MADNQTVPAVSERNGNAASNTISTVMTLGAAAALVLASRSAQAVSPALTFEANIPGTGDVKVLNYALALEDLEADLYHQAVLRLTTGGTNALGTTIPGLNLDSSQVDVAYATEFAAVEQEHSDFLRAALGTQAITKFKYNFGMESLSRQGVSQLLYDAEATGVHAYLGAIPNFATKTYLPVAAGILGTEARHTAALAIVQNILFNANIETAPLANENNGRDTPLTPDQVLAHVSPFIVIS